MISDEFVTPSSKTTVYIEKFKTNAEVVETIQSRNLVNRMSPHNRYLVPEGMKVTAGSPGWSGFMDSDELRDLVSFGVDDDCFKKQVKAMAGAKTSMTNTPARTRVTQVTGGAVHMGRYLSGSPQCMVRVRKQVKKSPVIKIGIDVSVSAYVTKNEMEAMGRNIAEAVRGLEASGYSIRLDVVSGFSYDRSTSLLVCRAKSEGEPMNLRRMLYPLVSVSYVRGMAFSWAVTEPHAQQQSNLGMPIYYGLKPEDRDALYKHVLGDDAVQLNLMSLIDSHATAEDIRRMLLGNRA